MSDETLADLIKKYHFNEETLLEKEKAFIEARVWALCEKIDGETRDKCLQRLLSSKPYESRQRSRLFNMKDADTLWGLVHKDMPVATANDLAHEAKVRALNLGIPFEEALEMELDEYNSRPTPMFLEGGKVVRRGKPTVQSRRKAIPAPATEGAQEASIKDPGDEDLLPVLNTLVDRYVQERAGEEPGFEVNVIVKDFKAEVQTAFSSFKARFKNHVSRGKKRVSFTEVLDACETLDIDPPESGAVPDMEMATKKFRILVKQYHPDANGNTQTVEIYKRVVEAHNVLKEYNHQVELSSFKAQHRGSSNKR